MKLDEIIKKLMPKDNFFFSMIETSALNLVEVAKEFKKFGTTSPGNFPELSKTIKDLEHNGDKTTYKIFEELNKTFLTPIDREDIRELTGAIDDIIDIIDSVAARIVLYEINEITPEMKEILEIILKCAEELCSAAKKLRKSRSVSDVHATMLKVHTLEEDGDRIYRKTIAKLFDKEKDPIKLLKYKEIYEALEKTVDRCKFTGDVIETVFMKNA